MPEDPVQNTADRSSSEDVAPEPGQGIPQPPDSPLEKPDKSENTLEDASAAPDTAPAPAAEQEHSDSQPPPGTATAPTDSEGPDSPGQDVRAKEQLLSTLKTRIKLGSILLTLVLTLLAADHFLQHSYFFILLLTLVTAIAMIEFYRMAKQAGSQPWWVFGTFFGVLLVAGQWVLLNFENMIFQTEGATLVLVIYLITIMIINFLMPDRKNEAGSIAITTFGILYIAFFMSFFVKIRAMHGGEQMIFMILLGCKCTDIGAYLIGRKFGTMKLIPKVSPGKTVEGAVGGLFCGVAASVLVYFISGLASFKNFPLTTAILLGCLISLFSMSGDLFESLIKRRYKVKDSAALFPAFGGMLDVIDSILMTGPLMYFIILGSGILQP